MITELILKKVPNPYAVVKIVLDAYFTTFHNLSISGLENIPDSGPIIFASNHTSFYDPPAIGVKNKRQINYLARDTLFKGALGKWLTGIGTIPISRGTADMKSIKCILKTLKENKTTAIFPEGTRSYDGKLSTPQAGIGMIAIKSNSIVIPTRVFGAFEAFNRNKKLPTIGIDLHVSYGPPLSPLSIDPGKEHNDRYLEASKKIMLEIEKLSPPNPSII